MELHINKEGLSNVLVEDLVRRITKYDKHFLGVFTYKNIPKRKVTSSAVKASAAGRNIVAIINVGRHFVTLVIGHDAVIYIDSFAETIPPKLKHLRALMSDLTKDGRRQLYLNKLQIQHYSSTHCGLYAALFAVWYLTRPEYRMAQSFHHKASKLNDELCVRYLKNFIKRSNNKFVNN